MRAAILAVFAVGVLAVAACQQTSVRGPEGEKLTSTAPLSMTLRRGESAPLKVGIDRENFKGPVTVAIAQLPKGVDADKSTMTVDAASATFSLTASKTADIVAKQAVIVTVAALDGRTTTQYVDLTVTD